MSVKNLTTKFTGRSRGPLARRSVRSEKRQAKSGFVSQEPRPWILLSAKHFVKKIL